MIALFDVDGTLYKYKPGYNEESFEEIAHPVIVALLNALKATGWQLYAWSGGGADYAETLCREMGIDSFFKGFYSKLTKLPFEPDLVLDDEDEFRLKGAPKLKPQTVMTVKHA